MKTQMRIKTGGESLFEKRMTAEPVKSTKNKPTVLYRYAGCAALIAILAASGILGAGKQSEIRTAAAPVVSTSVSGESYAEMTFEEIEKTLREEREQEIALLDSVISDASAAQDIKDSARKQKLQLAQRMEMESEVKAALAHMGYAQSAVLCSNARTMLMIPEQYAQSDADTTRIVDAAAAVTGCEAKDVKIILVKK